MPRPYRASADLTAVGTNRQCLPEIATAPVGPRNDTSGECRGAPVVLLRRIQLLQGLDQLETGIAAEREVDGPRAGEDEQLMAAVVLEQLNVG